MLGSWGSMQNKSGVLQAAYMLDYIAGCMSDVSMRVSAFHYPKPRGGARKTGRGRRKLPETAVRMTDNIIEMLIELDRMYNGIIGFGGRVDVQSAGGQDILAAHSTIHELERQTDTLYRQHARTAAPAGTVAGLADYRLVDGITQSLEETADTCMRAADAFLIMSTTLD